VQEENMKSLMKTFDILDLFLKGNYTLSVTEISKLLSLNKTTVSRILSKLQKRGYLRQIEKRGKFVLGTIFLEFSGIVKSQLKLREVALPFLFELNQLVKESVIFAMWDRRKDVITETFHEASYPESPLKVVPDEGTSIPLFCTCLGKIILADMSESELEEYFKNNHLIRRTPKTIIDIETLKSQLVKIRKEGIAFDDEEYAIGVFGIASDIKDSTSKVVGSAGILAPSARLSHEKRLELAPILKQYSDNISKQLGYKDNNLNNNLNKNY
jgi:IclR family transcriptional regulator, KDG regulon repressor